MVSEDFVAKIVDFSHARSQQSVGSGRDLFAEDIYAVGLFLMEMLLLQAEEDDDGDDPQAAASISGLLSNCYRAVDTGTGGPLDTAAAAALLMAQFDALRRLPIDASTAPAAFIALAFRCCDPRSSCRPSAAQCVEECDLMLIDIGLQLDEWHYPHYRSFTPIAPDGASIPPLFVRAVQSSEEEEEEQPSIAQLAVPGRHVVSADADAADADAACSEGEYRQGSSSFEQHGSIGSMSVEVEVENSRDGGGGDDVENSRDGGGGGGDDVELSVSNAPSWESSSNSRFDMLIPSK